MKKSYFKYSLIFLLPLILIGLVKAAPPAGIFSSTAALTIDTDPGANPVAANPYTIVSNGAEINTTDDLRIQIPLGVSAVWDSSVTTPTLDTSGNSTGAVSATVSYADADKTLIVDVTTNFSNEDSVTISGLQFIPGAVASAADELEWSVDAGANYLSGDLTTQLTVSDPTIITNIGPALTQAIVDDSFELAPTNVGSDVTFTAVATDNNLDQYYLAICQTDAITPVNNAAPICDGGAWAISSATDSDSLATAVYTAQAADPESNDWFGFICDVPATNDSTCHPTSGLLGNSLATISFTDMPVDLEYITVDGVIYQFDVAGGACVDAVAEDLCVDLTLAETESEVVSAIVSVEGGVNSTMYGRGSTLYIYADTPGSPGNTVTLGVTNCLDCVSSGLNLSGADTDTAAPFIVNHAPVFSNVVISNSADDLVIEPGDTLKVSVDIVDADSLPASDNVQLHVCSSEATMGGVTTSFDYITDTCVDGTLLCSSGLVDPLLGAVSCDDITNSISIPTAHGSYDVQVYVEDEHGLAGAGTTTNSFSIADVAPTLGSYFNEDILNIPVSGSDTLSVTFSIFDPNGDLDVISAEATFFDSVGGALGSCTANEQNCYITTCDLIDVGVAGIGKEATGTDADLVADCHFNVLFNANSSFWDIQGRVVDDLGPTSFLDAGFSIDVPPLFGVGVNASSLDYLGTLPFEISSGVAIPIQNLGNQDLDILYSSSLMCPDFPLCLGNTIPPEAQYWNISDINFSLVSEGNQMVLSGTEALGPASSGCVDLNLPVRTNYNSLLTDIDVYNKFQAPGVPADTYTGLNTVIAVPSDSCL